MNSLIKTCKCVVLIFIYMGFLLFQSCTDMDVPNNKSKYNPADDPNMVCLPLSINYTGETSSRADGIVDGNDKEHKIDFDTNNECYAVFFGESNKVKYISQLYKNEQLGSGNKEPDSYSEYSIPVLAYIPSEFVTPLSNNERVFKPNLLKVLVVLNGGKIYQKIYNEVYDSNGNLKDKGIDDILKLTWNNPADYTPGSNFNGDHPDGDGLIGFNANGLFTMTSSAYFNEKNDLATAAEITGYAFQTLKDYLEYKENGKNKPTATIYVERMVSKFTAPTFKTEVIGSDRVFRPGLNAMNVVVQTWNGDLLVPERKDWRIHLLGWTINGTESSSYIFKNIETYSSFKYADELNDNNHHRSYWSIDPHYNQDSDFYPWQYRKAADRSDVISVQAGLSQPDNDLKYPVLRYNSFEDVTNQWSWDDAIYIHENTFDSQTFTPNVEAVLDARSTVLAGPHLLITGELYLEDPDGNDYSSSGVNFTKVDHIYSDRVRRYYMTEADWFKMFIKDINNTLKTQEKMSFHVFNWNEATGEKYDKVCSAITPYSPKIFIKQVKGNKKYSDDKALDVEINETPGYTYTEVTFSIVEQMYSGEGSLSTQCNVRNGDGRLIPWHDDLVILVYDEEQKIYRELEYEISDDPEPGWHDNKYKSFFYEWFGPIDHYNKGRMYYAGEIRHKHFNNSQIMDYYGNVRNHIYKFHVESISSIGIPVDDSSQIIIPGKYNYRDQLIVYLDIIDWHPKNSEVEL